MARLGAALFLPLFAFWAFLVRAVPTPESTIEGLSIGDIINALQLGLVTHLNVTVTLETLITNLVSVNFDVKNPLILEFTIDRVVSQAGINDTVYATFDHTFANPVVVPILGTANSGQIDNVLLTRGVPASLEIIPLGFLDLISTDVYIRAGTIAGQLGIPIPLMGLTQSKVPTSYNLSL